MKNETRKFLRNFLAAVSISFCGIFSDFDFSSLLSPTLSFADENGIMIIRDAETEEFLTDIVRKIFSVAKLNPKNAKVFIVNSDSINAFTIGNGYVFINSGLLLKFQNPLHLIAVLCHEAAHLSAGHINTMIGKLQTANSGFLMAMLAGIAGTIATGSPDALAVLLGYQMTAERLFLRFSRDQEFAADVLGAQFLLQLGYDPQAMIEVFEVFGRLEILEGAGGYPTYIRTHPKSIDRISAIKKLKQRNPQKDQKLTKCDPKIVQKYTRIIAKLRAYIGTKSPFQQTPKDDYSKAIYLHRKGRSKESIEILKKLVCKNPNDLYYKEALAQTLEESGRAAEAATYYKQICGCPHELAKNKRNIHPLIKIEYAKTLVETKQPDLAIKILEKVQYEDPLNPEIFRFLANAYGQKHQHGVSFLMLAQEQMLLNNYPKALSLLKASIKKLDKKKDARYIDKAKYFIKLIKRGVKNR